MKQFQEYKRNTPEIFWDVLGVVDVRSGLAGGAALAVRVPPSTCLVMMQRKTVVSVADEESAEPVLLHSEGNEDDSEQPTAKGHPHRSKRTFQTFSSRGTLRQPSPVLLVLLVHPSMCPCVLSLCEGDAVSAAAAAGAAAADRLRGRPRSSGASLVCSGSPSPLATGLLLPMHHSRCRMCDAKPLSPFFPSIICPSRLCLVLLGLHICQSARVAIIADPQLTDRYSYHFTSQGAPQFALPSLYQPPHVLLPFFSCKCILGGVLAWIIEFYSDLFMQRSFSYMQRFLKPTHVILLGDLLDSTKWYLPS